MKDRLTTAELAAETGIPPETLRYYRWRGEGPASYKIGRRVLYDRVDVEAWIRKQKAASLRGDAA